jgi:hypothetical protein
MNILKYCALPGLPGKMTTCKGNRRRESILKATHGAPIAHARPADKRIVTWVVFYLQLGGLCGHGSSGGGGKGAGRRRGVGADVP